MRKLKLELDLLAVETFSLSSHEGGPDGTVRANGEVPPQQPASDYNGVCDSYAASCNGTCASCQATCYLTCGTTCAGSCVNTCQLSCHSVCHELA